MAGIANVTGAPSTAGPYVQAATMAIGAYSSYRESKQQIEGIRANLGEQLEAGRLATQDFRIQAQAAQQQSALALEREQLAQRAEAEGIRQAGLIENVDVSLGQTAAEQRAARQRRRQFFQQEAV